ncbi:conserved hypothetical protein [Candidatus Roizmanbacteria bacterium]|nr:conserved hypothetical protein [Candidatus Roizmanbacteria bacterium]
MQSVSKCSQYYPYAGKTSLCGGNVHELIINYNDNPTEIIVCDSHMESFKALGERERFKFTIEGDKIIGAIALTTSLEWQRPKKERK